MTTRPRDGGQGLARPGATAARALDAAMAQPLSPGLYLVATPIGNLADITLRAIATLARADVVYCEDTRHSRTLMAHFGLSAPLKAYHEHNADAARPEILAALARGARIALISDAGTPLISDPGFKLVNAAMAAGYAVTSVPGPSAVISALVQSGLPTDTFLFAGFLPPKSAARQARLQELAGIPATIAFYEAPSRVVKCLADIADVMGAREVAVLRELTKLHEAARRGTAAALAEYFTTHEPRGEFVILIGPPTAIAASDDDIRQRLETALSSMSLRDAADTVAAACAVARGRVYDLALAMKRERDG